MFITQVFGSVSEKRTALAQVSNLVNQLGLATSTFQFIEAKH